MSESNESTSGPPVTIVVPTYREAQNLEPLAEGVRAAMRDAGMHYELIVVDDASPDSIAEVAERLAGKGHPIRLIVRENERDLSSAVIRGFREARGERLVCMDADLSHPPDAIPALLRAIDGGAELAIGSRYVAGGSTAESWGVGRWLKSKLATLLARPFTRLSDPMAGFFALPRHVFRRAEALNPLGYKIALELLIKCRIENPVEVPIHFSDRREGESKLGPREQLKYLIHLKRLAEYRFAGLFRLRWWMLAILLVGLVARVGLAGWGTRDGYLTDHFDNIGMGLAARANGLLNVYTIDREEMLPIPGQAFRDGSFHDYTRNSIFLPNYPPLTLTIFRAQIELLPEPLHVNTTGTRLIMAAAPFAGELAAAIVAGWIAFTLFGATRALWAGGLTWLAPPIALNATFWAQMDGMILAPGLLALALVLRRRWLGAGLCLALACLVKPQGLMFGPIALFGALLLPADGAAPGPARVVRRLALTGVAFVLGVVVPTLPWLVSSGLDWVRRAYWVSFVEAFPITTLKGFNIWYLDLLILDGRKVAGALDSTVMVLGLTKDAWGRLMTIGAMLGIGVLSFWRYRRTPMALLVYSALWLWSIFLFPTRVHERFILYCIPFVILAAVPLRRLWPALVLVLALGAAEHTWTVWLPSPSAGDYRAEEMYRFHSARHDTQMAAVPPAERKPYPPFERFVEAYDEQYGDARQAAVGREWLVTLLSLLAFAWALLAAFGRAPPETAR